MFVPALLSDDQSSKKEKQETLDAKVQNLLVDLEAGLGSVLRKQGKRDKTTGKIDESHVTGTLLKQT